MKQLCGEESNLVASFEKATRERGAKEKIIFNAASEILSVDKERVEIGKAPEVSTREEWENAIEQAKSGIQSQEQEIPNPEMTNKKDNVEH